MEYDYSKIVEFIYGRKLEKLNEVFKALLLEYKMIDVNQEKGIILLVKNDIKYYMFKAKDRILIIPINYNSVSFADDFNEICEISINSDNDIVISKIFNVLDLKGVASTTSTWHYENGLYNEVVSRVMFVLNEKINIVYNQETLDMFINKYYDNRKDILRDLYWDFNSYLKNNFIDIKFSERIMVSDGFNQDKIEVLYKKLNEKVYEVLKNKCKNTLFS